MPVGTIVGGSAISGGLSYLGAQKAASAQSKALNSQLSYQKEQAAPYTAAGKGAIASLAELYGIDPTTGARTGQPYNADSLAAFRNAPDYEFGRSEGQRALEFSNAAKGLVKSGNNLRDLVTFGNDYASSKFGNYFNHLATLANMGANAGQGVANTLGQLGEAKASGIVGGTNALSSAIGQGTNNYLLYSMLNKPKSTYDVPAGYPYSGVSNPYGVDNAWQTPGGGSLNSSVFNLTG
jgi:hypothetical protein